MCTLNMQTKKRAQSQFQPRKSLLAIAVICCIAGCAYTAMPNLQGSVIDSVTKEPITGALVDVYGRDGLEEHVVTDSQGVFRLKGEVHYSGFPIMLVPTLRFRVSARCYKTYEDVSHYPSFNSSNAPTILPTELSPSCTKPTAENPNAH